MVGIACKESACFTKSRSNHGGTRLRLVKRSEPVWPGRRSDNSSHQLQTALLEVTDGLVLCHRDWSAVWLGE